MAKEEHLQILKLGPDVWSNWRIKNQDTRPDLSGADLSLIELSGATFIYADLSGANLYNKNLFNMDFREAILRNANLHNTDLRRVNLGGADLSGADIILANLSEADLANTDFTNAIVGWTIFGNNDLSSVKGLDTVNHIGPSTIGIDTTYRSKGNISDKFLRGAGTPESFSTFNRSLVEAKQPIQFYSCFVSYSHQDEEFAKRLYLRMRDKNLRVWYAREEMKSGRKLHEQIFAAIQIHDKLLLVLSEYSMQSEWV